MRGFIDLHCHFVAGVDDGARDFEEGLAMLDGLHDLGFDLVVATPHMRPGMFENDKAALERAYATMVSQRTSEQNPRTALASEHYFDDVVYGRIQGGAALPYPGNRAILLEFYDVDFPRSVDRCFAELRRAGLLPVIAHPERYRCLWRSLEPLERLVDAGAAALLDTAAMAGKYGRKPRDVAEEILERELYHAACSDAHRPSDLEAVRRGMALIEAKYGDDEIQFLFSHGPQALLAGRLPTAHP